MRGRWAIPAVLAVASVIPVGCRHFGIQLGGTPKDAKPPDFVLRVNAGMHEPYIDTAGNRWLPDQPYTEGAPYGFTGQASGTIDRGANVRIAGTGDPRIYQTERWSMDSFVAAVPNGRYTVRLHFAETFAQIDTYGPRLFHVKIQGQVMLQDFNVQEVAGGKQRAVIMQFRDVRVADGKLVIEFVPNKQTPEINGIEIVAQ